MQLGKTIVKIRKEHELTQEDFAKKFNVTRQTVSNWENEKSYPDLLTLIKISDAFGYSLDTMLKENLDMAEDMNQNLKRGQILSKMYKKGIIIFIISAIACSVVFLLSLIDYNGVVKPLLLLSAFFVNVIGIITCILIKRIKQK